MDNLTFQIRTAIDKQKGDRFQEFVTYLLVERFGSKFEPNHRNKDKGSDGFINSTTALSVYAPDKANYSQFMRKIRKDYKKYEANWKVQYPKWCLIYNGEYTGQMRQFIKGIDPMAQTVDINRLVNCLKKMPWPTRRDIMISSLEMDESILSFDILKSVIEDMLSVEIADDSDTIRQPPLYIEDKVNLNFEPDEVEAILNEYTEILPDVAKMNNVVLKPYKDKDIDYLKNKVRHEYRIARACSNDFASSLDVMRNTLAGRNNSDDAYMYYLRVALIYFFEACLIGARTPEEKLLNKDGGKTT